MTTDTTTKQDVRSEIDAPVAVVTLDRPERRNALSLALMEQTIEALLRVSGEPEVRVIILKASGPAFSAGHDLSELVGREEEDYRNTFETCTRLMTTIHDLPQPVIAQVHAVATAAGCQLVAACDLAIASEKAAFATPGVKIGLFCTTPMVEVSRAVGAKRAMEMLLTGQPISAETAREWGLVNRVVSAEMLEDETRALALHIASASSFVIGLGKRAFYAQIGENRSDAYRYASGVMTENAMADDAQEGMRAFLEKRKPVWK